jgi:hypothetical protein
MKTIPVIASLLVLTGSTACTSGRAQGPNSNPDVITREQLERNKFRSAYEAVQSLHSNWLQARGPDSFNTPSIVLVYFDDVKLGGVETLHTIQASTVSYIRHYNGNEATSRFGIGHSAGVIYVSTRPISMVRPTH